MITENLKVNQLSQPVYDWYLCYLRALDAKSVPVYGGFLAESCVMQMNNAEPVVGKAAILDNLSKYWATFGSLEHDLLNLYGSDQAFVLEALNHYRRLDGKPVTCRAVAFTDRGEDGLVTSFRLYSDTTPLFS